MGSRIRDNVRHLFECWCEVVGGDGVDAPWIIQQYPDTYRDQEVLQAVPKFAFPCKFDNTTVQHYSFVLTDAQSQWTFGFCRHDPKTHTALVVLSYLPWHHPFYKFLNKCAVLVQSPDAGDLRSFLQAGYTRRVPEPGATFHITFNEGRTAFAFECPDRFKLPSIPEDRNLTEYYSAVDGNTMIQVFAALLHERRVVVTSRRLYRVSACVQAANHLLYPMVWQHIFIPVLPAALVDYLLAPMPYLIGVPQQVWQTVQRSEIGDVVVLDVDNNTIETPFDDLNNLPPEIVNTVRRQLRGSASMLGDGVSRAFLRALVNLLGGYRDALQMREGARITFHPPAFIQSRSPNIQPFLQRMLELQIFQQFIEERLQMLNAGAGFTDEFELEVHHYSEKSSSKFKQQYRDWTAHMRKEGSAFFKHVKDKANPAVKTAVKSVKESGKGMKSAYKGLKSKFRESQGPDQLQQVQVTKPRSAPNSPTEARRNISAPFGNPKCTYRKDSDGMAVSRRPPPISPPDSADRSETGTPSLDIPPMDLLTEIRDLLHLQPDSPTNLQLPTVDRTLKPVRSLENFSPTITKVNTSQEIRPKLFDTQLSTTTTTDLFGSAPFVVGGGKAENGAPVFLVAADHHVDMVKLSPPLVCPAPPRRKRQENHVEDLIRLDSNSDLAEFDPLLCGDKQDRLSVQPQQEPPPTMYTTGLSNPLYTYFVPKGRELHQPQSSRSSNDPQCTSDKDLLQEYGLDFNKFNVGSTSSSENKIDTKKQWTTFD